MWIGLLLDSHCMLYSTSRSYDGNGAVEIEHRDFDVFELTMPNTPLCHIMPWSSYASIEN